MRKNAGYFVIGAIALVVLVPLFFVTESNFFALGISVVALVICIVAIARVSGIEGF